MKLQFIQYTSPEKASSPGYRWHKKGPLSNDALEKIDECIRQVSWKDSEEYNGGIIFLFDNDLGVVFRRIHSTFHDCVGRSKITINGLVFSISEAQHTGVYGIWDLPYLADDTEERECLEYSFTAATFAYSASFEILSEVFKRKNNAFFKISKKNEDWFLEKIKVPIFGTTKTSTVNQPKEFFPMKKLMSFLLFVAAVISVFYGITQTNKLKEEKLKYEQRIAELMQENADLKECPCPKHCGEISKKLDRLTEEMNELRNNIKKQKDQ